MQPGNAFEPAPRLLSGRFVFVLAVVLLLEIIAVSASGSASAQGLLDSWFGGGLSKPKPYPPMPNYPQRSLYAPYSPYGAGSGGSSWPSGNTYDNGPSGGSYRTVCVRMCDGYYYPISFGVSRASFGRDAAACQSGCGSDARLFYHSTTGSAETMVDLSGRPYTTLPNAFKYRKKLVDSCACKPAPWSETEAARHQQYAVAEGKLKPAATTEVARAPDAVARPAVDEPTVVAGAPLTTSRAPMVPREAAVPITPPAGRIPSPRPEPVLLERTAQLTRPPTHTPSRPSGKMGVGGPVPPPSKPQAKSSGSPAVYSHELGRFVFPNERARGY